MQSSIDRRKESKKSKVKRQKSKVLPLGECEHPQNTVKPDDTIAAEALLTFDLLTFDFLFSGL